MQTDPKTLARLEELLKLKRDTDAEIDSIVSGVDKPKRQWTRRNGADTQETAPSQGPNL